MKPESRRQDQLLAETVHDGWAGGPGAEFARQAASLARRRRRIRQSLLATGATAGLAVLLLGLLLRPAPVRDLPQPRLAAPAYEIISDDELLTQLRDRPLLAIRKENGAREFVLLDPRRTVVK